MHILNDEIMQALCWTLVHSLWQGLLLAVLGGILIMLTKKSTSVLRYNVLSVLFFSFIATACFTFQKQLHLASASNRINHIVVPVTSQQADIPFYPADEMVAEKTNLEIFVNYFNEHASLIVAIWFIVLSAHCVKLMANAGYIQRVRHYKTHAPSEYWKLRMQELADRLLIKKQILLLESEIVKVPMMVGFLKPVILFPFSLMSQLPPEQVEAVLLHELAHIRRKDYFVNLLQSFVEIVFFFNPGVLWISSLIRDERENCCDDIAISETKSKKEFIHALVSFQEYNMATSKYALAFPGRKNHLLNRVKRIITNNNKTLNNMEKISLAAGIVIIGLMTIAFKETVKQNTLKTEPSAKAFQAKEIVNDTVPDKKEPSRSNYDISVDGKKYRMKEVDNKVVEFYVDGKRIADDKIGDYQKIIDKIHLDMKKQQDALQLQNLLLEKHTAELMEEQEHMRKEQEEMRERNGKANSEEDIQKMKAEQEILNEKMKEYQLAQEAYMRDQSRKANQEMQLELIKQNEQLAMLTENIRKRQEELRQEAKSVQQKDYKKQNELLNKQIMELRYEQQQIQKQRLKINEMLLNFNHGSSMLTPVTPDIGPVIALDVQPVLGSVNIALDAQPVLETVDIGAPVPVIDNVTVSSVIDDLLEEKVITNQNDLSFTLNNEILKVNGVVQPKELHARLKEKYIKSKKDHVIYSKHGGSTHTEVSIDN